MPRGMPRPRPILEDWDSPLGGREEVGGWEVGGAAVDEVGVGVGDEVVVVGEEEVVVDWEVEVDAVDEVGLEVADELFVVGEEEGVDWDGEFVEAAGVAVTPVALSTTLLADAVALLTTLLAATMSEAMAGMV